MEGLPDPNGVKFPFVDHWVEDTGSMATTRPSEQDVTRFLGEQFDHISDVVLLASGAWSSAFAFRSAGRDLVAKCGQYPEDYAKDLEASASARSNLPIPAVLAVGEAFDGAFVISERRYGDSLVRVSPDRFRAVINALFDALFDALLAMREIELPGRAERPQAPPRFIEAVFTGARLTGRRTVDFGTWPFAPGRPASGTIQTNRCGLP